MKSVRKVCGLGSVTLCTLLMLTFIGREAFAFNSGKDADWPSWRGKNGDGKWQDAPVFKFDEGYGLKMGWKQDLGSSYSSISVLDNRAVTMFSDSTFDYVVALDIQNGNELWRHKIDSTYIGHNGSHNGQISTPVIDGDKVYVYARKGQLFALDAKTGKPAWQHNIQTEFSPIVPQHGFGTSPLIDGDILIVMIGDAKGRAISGFDKNSGKQLWATGNDTINYQSPSLAMIAGEKVLLCPADRVIKALNPKTGELVWSYRHNGGWGSANPVVVGDDKIFLNDAFAESEMLQVTKTGNTYDIKELWKTRDIRQTFNVSIYHNGHLYGYSGRFLSCVNAETGESVWKSRPPGDGFLILVDNHLVIVTKQGTLHIAEASTDKYTELANVEVFDNLTWTPPSFANGRIFARSLEQIAAIDIAPVEQMTKIDEPEIEYINPKGEFSKFVKNVEAASAGEKKALVDAFMKKHTQSPIIEGQRFAHIVYNGSATDVAITGDMLPSGQEAPLRRVPGTDFFYISFELEPDARLDYILRRDFDNLITDPGNPYKVPSFALPANEVSELRMPGWKAPTHFDEPKEGVARGTIETFELDSKIMENKRNVHVYLPAGYSGNDTRYPTVYVNYGNFAKDMGLMPNTLDNLIAAKKIKPVIAVFVEAPASFQEYARQGRDNHAQMYIEELLPLIDGKYRTMADGKSRLFMGADEGGFAAIYAAFKYPGSATMVAGQSTHLHLGAGGEEINAIIKDSPKRDVSFYLDWATYGQRGNGFDWKIYNRDFNEMLQKKGYSVVSQEVNEGFGWASWRNRTDKILMTFFAMDKDS